MSSCPKCGHKLRIIDISQYCPQCGVNMRFYNFEENFIREAKQAELAQAKMHIKIQHLIASFIGSRLTIAKLCVMLLPAASMLLPAGGVSIALPFADKSFDIGILGIYGMFSGGDINYILKMVGSGFVGSAFSAFVAALGAYAATALMAVLVFMFSLLGFISIKNMQKLTCAAASLGISGCGISAILIERFKRNCGNVILSGKSGFGLMVTALMFAAVFVINILLVRKGIPVKYKEGMLERAAIADKVKIGEVNIDDLPQPVVETEETRKIDEEIAKEEAAYAEKYKTHKEAAT